MCNMLTLEHEKIYATKFISEGDFSTKLIINHKIIHDNIHEQLTLSNYACKIIDTKWFQRLRYLEQLGLCSRIWPCANHTRFSHSIGTYYTTGLFLKAIMENSDVKHIEECLIKIKELKDSFGEVPYLSDRICELIKISGLCHDLGHGPFSHVFDDIILKDCKSPLARHEVRSCIILEKIIEERKIPITKNDT